MNYKCWFSSIKAAKLYFAALRTVATSSPVIRFSKAEWSGCPFPFSGIFQARARTQVSALQAASSLSEPLGSPFCYRYLFNQHVFLGRVGKLKVHVHVLFWFISPFGSPTLPLNILYRWGTVADSTGRRLSLRPTSGFAERTILRVEQEAFSALLLALGCNS